MEGERKFNKIVFKDFKDIYFMVDEIDNEHFLSKRSTHNEYARICEVKNIVFHA